MKRATAAGLLFAGSVIAFAGCDTPNNSGTNPPATTERKRDVDIQIRTPGADVDVQRKGEGKAKVDVRTKETGR